MKSQFLLLLFWASIGFAYSETRVLELTREINESQIFFGYYTDESIFTLEASGDDFHYSPLRDDSIMPTIPTLSYAVLTPYGYQLDSCSVDLKQQINLRKNVRLATIDWINLQLPVIYRPEVTYPIKKYPSGIEGWSHQSKKPVDYAVVNLFDYDAVSGKLDFSKELSLKYYYSKVSIPTPIESDFFKLDNIQHLCWLIENPSELWSYVTAYDGEIPAETMAYINKVTSEDKPMITSTHVSVISSRDGTTTLQLSEALESSTTLIISSPLSVSLHTSTLAAGTVETTLPSLSPGIYFYTLEGAGLKRSGKIVVR